MLKSQFAQKDVEIKHEGVLYQGFFCIKQLKLRFRRFEGGWIDETTLEVFDRNPVAGVLPYDPIHDKVVLIEQFRPGCYRDPQPWQFEIVAGIIETGETPEAMAHRETQEEAGLTLSSLKKIYEYWPSPGGSTEYLTLFCGEVDTRVAGGIFGAHNEMENIKVHVVDCDDAFSLLKKGAIRNAATIIALQWLQLTRPNSI